MMWQSSFWKAALERAIKSFCYSLLGNLIAGDFLFDIVNFQWLQALGTSAGIALISILGSLGSNKLGNNVGPSLSTETIISRHPNGPLRTAP
jgi:hypothetical protein